MDDKNNTVLDANQLDETDLAHVAGGKKLIWTDGYQYWWDDGTVTGTPNPWITQPEDPPSNDDEWL